jgi:hypothetical protein
MRPTAVIDFHAPSFHQVVHHVRQGLPWETVERHRETHPEACQLVEESQAEGIES